MKKLIEQTIANKEIKRIRFDFDANDDDVIAQLTLWTKDRTKTEKCIVPITVNDIKKILNDFFK